MDIRPNPRLKIATILLDAKRRRLQRRVGLRLWLADFVIEMLAPTNCIRQPTWCHWRLCLECYPSIRALQSEVPRSFWNQPTTIRPVTIDDQFIIDQPNLQRWCGCRR